ncbi:MAG: hypothetical protein V7L29_33260 [Nostoc sp.]|uniref:hypothetical protein n=1 Tax=Nostoc sp. TaxID=1180 RepID=UPI002FF11A69
MLVAQSYSHAPSGLDAYLCYRPPEEETWGFPVPITYLFDDLGGCWDSGFIWNAQSV